MKSKLLLLFSAILMSLSLQAQNSIDILTPPQSVQGNTNVDITFNYTLAVDGYAYIRFKNGPDTEHNLTYVSKLLSAGSGTETLSLPIPNAKDGEALPPGGGYNYQAQLFDHNAGWLDLATEDYYGVDLTAASNFILLSSGYPTTVNAGESVDISFDYATDYPGGAHAFVRLKDASGNLTAASVIVAQGSGTETVQLPIPANALGTDYGYQVQLFDHNDSYAYIDGNDYTDITVEVAKNSITLNTPPTNVEAGSDVNINLDYVTDLANAHIFVRFKDASGNLTDVNQIVSAGSGSLTLPLPIPGDALGSGYSYQVQLFDIDNGYNNIISNDLPEDVTVVAAPANTVAISNPVSPVLINSSVDITVSYTQQTEDYFIGVRFLDGDGNEVTSEFGFPTGNSGDIVISLDTPTTEADNYSYNVQLYDLLNDVVYEKTYRGIVATASLGTADIANSFNNLSIFPNPATDSFSYKFNNQLTDSVRIELFSINGRKIKVIEHDNTSLSNGVNTSDLSKGVYLVRFTSNGLQETKRLIIK
ncbi:T9SS type A sorting domain-containing protein [Tamlana sp. 2_MG-2023]|uniref:T9SS type A sorting domain-containing protein n=1 Tax=unclassified Tamlana TaxID=2614803 RepID=UPI0026E27503|nr:MULTISPECIES: T9SS type A sorting domain-containing protein [unclassified Tamlana]MDO6759990.1 T9SS type A sorting domain-containing protein [Tamlana sp. 2_MG-2023]MDO6791840.1 T9SS type A sorting domain-containing protein [Tamlana sp. 1_MG-2023]